MPATAWGPLFLLGLGPAYGPRQRSRCARLRLVSTDTIAIIVAILGVGLALQRAIDSRYKDLRQDIKETSARIDSMGSTLNARIESVASALNARIDALYQALFSHKDPAA